MRANKDSAAREAKRAAEAGQAAAGGGQAGRGRRLPGRTAGYPGTGGEVAQLDAEKAAVEQQLVAAQNVAGLQSQRRRYQEWLAAKQREEDERARAAAAAAATGRAAVSTAPPAGAGGPAATATGRGVDVVIGRALSQLGVPYAWGGGNANGPTRGIRDGGVADSFGDDNKTGLDCSGLIIYAFAGVGIRLPHYPGYQAESGRKFPVAQMRPGDMLFWAAGGRIHHVALYVGDGMMVKAPQSGSQVRVTRIRPGPLPYVTRLL